MENGLRFSLDLRFDKVNKIYWLRKFGMFKVCHRNGRRIKGVTGMTRPSDTRLKLIEYRKRKNTNGTECLVHKKDKKGKGSIERTQKHEKIPQTSDFQRRAQAGRQAPVFDATSAAERLKGVGATQSRL